MINLSNAKTFDITVCVLLQNKLYQKELSKCQPSLKNSEEILRETQILLYLNTFLCVCVSVFIYTNIDILMYL